NDEPFIPLALIAFAALGTIISWLAAWDLLDRETVRAADERLRRVWRLAGFPVILCLLLLAVSAGGWAGRYRAIDTQGSSFFGLLPYSDAFGYFQSSFSQAFGDHWGLIGSRRAVAQAFRDLLLVAGNFSHQTTVLIQVAVGAAALSFAAASLARWRGLWAAMAFVGFSAAVMRPFIGTMLTEPLSGIFALLALPFLFEALRRGSPPPHPRPQAGEGKEGARARGNGAGHGVVALVFLTLALLARMGDVLLVPIMVAWLALMFGDNVRQKIAMAVLASASVVAVLAVNATLESLYGPPGAAAGGNFTLTLCGLSVGADWPTCYYQFYPDAVARFGGDEKGLSVFFLRQSIDNILHDPWPFIGAVFTNIRRYVGDFPRFYLSGYIWIFQMSPWRGWLMFALAPGIVYVLRKRATPAERLFWAGLVASAVLSAAIVLGDDGWRVLHATHFPFAALFALGFVTPRDTAPAEPVAPGWRSGAAFAVGALALLLLAPA